MQATNGSGGLCMTCNNAPGCYHRARRGPALFCELFDDYVPSTSRFGGSGPALRTPAAAVAVQEEEGGAQAGLCMNCEHRRTCSHPKPAGGVWHCEDYE